VIMEYIKLGSYTVPHVPLAAALVGSGAAGLACADRLHRLGVRDIALITEGMNMGTSRNTGSDKQTYYKLSLTGDREDSVYELASTLFSGGAMHGDLALAEAAGSARAFFNLVELGVPFPTNDYGEYVAYRTDHDGGRRRATSCGPLTSRIMTDRLEEAVRRDGIRIFDGCRAVEILTSCGKVTGVLGICRDYVGADNPFGLILFSAPAVVWATGGPAAVYAASVYPESQTGSHGAAFLAGAEGCNLTEWQYGIASVSPRWNLSGSFQQVIPRYFSVGEDGKEREFLQEIFASPTELFGAVFLKGYEWPFDPAKCEGISFDAESGRINITPGGSSTVDLAVYAERMRGRRVFLDFTRNPEGYSPELLPDDAREYLAASGALDPATPYERLCAMNRRAAEFYKSHGVDLSKTPLEIDVCAQHNNGGFAVDIWYESTSLSGFFVIGEAAGVFGVKRPGGSALNSTQVGALRAAQRIASRAPAPQSSASPASRVLPLLEKAASGGYSPLSAAEIRARRQRGGMLMSRSAAFIRDPDAINGAIAAVRAEIDCFEREIRINRGDFDALFELAIYFDTLVTRYVYLCAMREYERRGGVSRGSYLIPGRPAGSDPLKSKICAVKLPDLHSPLVFRWEDARPIPNSEQWFEKVYNK